MPGYKYAPAVGYLSPYPAAAPTHHPTHEGIESHRYHQRDNASVKSYHSRSSHVKPVQPVETRSTYSYDARSTHSYDTRSAYAYDARSEVTTFDARSVYSPDTRSVRSADPRPTYEPDTRSTYSYNVRSGRSDAGSIYSADARSYDVKSVRSTGARSSRSKSRSRADPEPQQFLNVQAVTPAYYRSSSAAGSHRSRTAPSLTHSVPSTSSDDENESEAGHPVNVLNTPYTAKVALWRDDVHDLCNDVPPETIIPPHLLGQYDEHGRRQHNSSPSLSSGDAPSIVAPSYSVPSRSSSLRSTSSSPPYIPPEVSAADLERVTNEIEDIEYDVNSRILEFTFPNNLDIGEKLPNGEFPPLAYTGRNKPLIEHRHYLDKSLLRMDEIQSFNDSQVKTARKRVVTKIQEQLEQLNRMEKMVRDNMHYERWKKKTPRIQVTAPPSTT